MTPLDIFNIATQLGAQYDDSRPGLACFKPIYQARLLDKDKSKRMIDERAPARQNQFFFDTGVTNLNLRNLIAQMGSLIYSMATPAKIQDKISNCFNSQFGIAKHSLPELQLLSDILFLTSRGIIESDTLLDYNPYFEDLDEQTSQFSWFLTVEKAETLYGIRPVKNSQITS